MTLPAERPAALRRPLRLLAVLCLLAVLADATYEKHPHFGFEGWPAFHAGFSFVACVVLVALARVLRLLVRRREDYYDR